MVQTTRFTMLVNTPVRPWWLHAGVATHLRQMPRTQGKEHTLVSYHGECTPRMSMSESFLQNHSCKPVACRFLIPSCLLCRVGAL